MGKSKWWDLAFGAGLVILALIAWAVYAPNMQWRWGAWITLAALGVCYAAIGRRALWHPSFALPFVIVLIVACGVAALFSPTLATLQALAIPYLWWLTPAKRRAILLTVVLVVSVAIGMLVGLGWSVDALLEVLITQGLSLTFSIVFALWISSIAEAGDERGRLLAELTAAQDQLAAGHREAGISSERERLAREIHDTIAQSLTSLVLLAQRARGELGRLPGETADATAEATPELAESVDLIETTARDALTDARSLVAALAPLPVGQSSLAEVMRRLAQRFDRETGVRVRSSVTASAVPRDLEVVLLRCAQEGLANVRKHAKATEASVTVERAQDAVRLEVHDNGRGLAGYTPGSDAGFGLNGMRDRVALVGGRLTIAGQAGDGTTLVVTIPLAESATAGVQNTAAETTAAETTAARDAADAAESGTMS